MERHKYTNPKYYSQVNDFGDDYNKPDDENNKLLIAVKKIKRRYRNYLEYGEATTIYYNYMRELIDKYGGKKRFKFLKRLHMIHDYIPTCPVLRKIKQNREFINGNQAYYTETKLECIHFDTKWKIPTKRVKVTFVNKPIPSVVINSIKEETLQEKINNEIDMISNFYNNKLKPTRLSSVEQRKAYLSKLYKSKNRDMTVKEKLKEYYRKKDYGIYDDEPSENSIKIYKGTSLSIEDYNSIRIVEALRSVGFNVDRSSFSNKSRKLVMDKKKKKKGKKKNKHRDSYMKRFADGKISTFADYERGMSSLLGKDLEKGSIDF